MSYESDPSGQPLPGDSDSLNRSGHVPQEEQNSWLLDGETTPPASQPAQPEPVRVADSPNWLLDGEQAEEPSLVITEDTEGDSWLMNVDDPTATLEVDEVTQDQGFSASYCEPESTASVFGRLLVPAVFVSVLSVGGLLVWRSMSGLGVGPNGAGEGGVVHVPSENTGGEKLAGPTFAVPGTGRNANGSSTRGSIQRDGSVKQAKSGLSASVAQGQFGFTPSSQNTSTASKLETTGLSNGEEHNHAETHEAPETLAQVEPAEIQTEGERLEGTPTVPSDLETAPSEENVDLAQSESVEGEGKVVIDLFGMAFVTADIESGSQELYQVQPCEDRLLTFESSLTFPMVGLPLWGPGTPVEPSIAMEFEENLANVTGDPVDESLLTEEQEQMLAMADEDGSVELAFLWVEEPSANGSVAAVEETTGFDFGDESTENATPVEEQESAAVVSLEPEVEGTPLGHAFLDELLAMEPIGGDEGVPEAQQGFEVKPLEDWTENGDETLAQAGTDSVAGVDLEVDPLPISEGLNDQGQWKIGGSDSNPTGPVAMGSSTEAEQAFVELWSEGTELVTAPVSAEGMQGLAKVDPSGVEHSVPTDLGTETQASIEPMVFEDPMFEIQEIGMVPAPTEVTIDWVDPLSDWLPTEGHNAKTPVTEDSNLAQGLPEQTTETDSLFEETEELELPVLVGDLEGEASLLVDGTEVTEDGVLGSANAVETPAEATSIELVEGEELAQVLVDDVMLTEDESTLDRQVEDLEESAIAQMLPEVEGAGEQAAESTETPVAPTDSAESMVTEFETDGTPTALVAAEPVGEVGPVAIATPEPIQVETPSPEGDAALEELLGVTPVEAPVMEEIAKVESTDDAVETVEVVGERSLLDMYSDWNQAEDEGQLQPLSSSKWMNFSVDGGESLPFRMAQASIANPQEERASEPAPVVVPKEETKVRMGVLKRRKSSATHWEGMEVPMHAIANEAILLTPQVGPVRVIAKDGETIEGRLHGIGQNYVWLTTNLGRLSIPGRRVERVERIDPNQFTTEVKSTQDYTKLPKVRVRMKGGVFIGHELAREGNRITIRTEKGHKMTLVSDDIRPAKSHKATGIKRRIE